LVVRSDRIESPLDLDGTTMCTPPGSTMDYHLSFVKLLNPGMHIDVVHAGNMECRNLWHAGKIDGAFVYGPYLTNLSSSSGNLLYTSSGLGDWGKPTTQIIIAHRRVLDDPDTRRVAARIAAVAGVLDDSFLDAKAGDRAAYADWDPDDAEGFLASIGFASDGKIDATTPAARDTVLHDLFKNERIRTSSQIGCGGLGDPAGGACPTLMDSLFMAEVATFNWEIKSLSTTTPTGRHVARYDDSVDASGAVRPAAYHLFSNQIDAGPLAEGLQDVSLDALKAARPDWYLARSGTAAPDAPSCSGVVILRGRGAFDDGAGGRRGTTYSPSRECVWVVVGESADAIVEVAFSFFRVWAGDAVYAYEGRLDDDAEGAADVSLLGKFSGTTYDPPLVRGRGAVSLRFVTDSVETNHWFRPD
jgi:hypothetical protein